MVFPAQDGPYGNRGERVHFELQSGHLENEFKRLADVPPGDQQGGALETLGRMVWRRTGHYLRSGRASRQLAEARKVHRLRLAAFDYCFGEGLFRLIELDEEAAPEMVRVLNRSKRE
jgi:hypothetical protein